jgi:hypothetical protein
MNHSSRLSGRRLSNQETFGTLAPAISGCTGNSGGSASAVGFTAGQEGMMLAKKA